MAPKGQKIGVSFLRSFTAASLGLALGVFITWCLGESPGEILRILWESSFGSRYQFGMTLTYTAPLIFTGLAVSLGMQGGMLNIGAEGQLTVGSLCAAIMGIYLQGSNPFWAVPLILLAGFCGGGLWGTVAAFFKVFRGSHEVVTTIMLNFVAAGLASWVVLDHLRSPTSQSPETPPLDPGFMLPTLDFFEGAPVGWGLILGILVCLVIWVLNRWSLFGYRLRALGLSQMSGFGDEAVSRAGISVGRMQFILLGVGGGLAGLVCATELLGHAGRYRLGFSPGFGMMGIPVALVARSHPLGVLASALLFGSLQKGALDLELETTTVTRDLGMVIQALIVMMMAGEGAWSLLAQKWKSHRSIESRGSTPKADLQDTRPPKSLP